MANFEQAPSDNNKYQVEDGSYREAVLKSIDMKRGAFGEVVTTHKTPIVQISNKYEIDPDNLDAIEIFEATGGERR